MGDSAGLKVQDADAGTLLRFGIKRMLAEENVSKTLGEDHVKDTPTRFWKAMQFFLSGCDEDPEKVLGTDFEEPKYDQLIVVREIDFVSICAHHLLPFIGRAHFGYLPRKKVVGLSKIPRLIDVLSRRPQIQEKLSHDIVDTFQKVVQPKGCGIVLSANHLCMSIRGIKKANAMTDTTALTGDFLSNTSLKQEFLAQVFSRR